MKKKLLVVLFIGLVTVLLTGCGGDKPQEGKLDSYKFSAFHTFAETYSIVNTNSEALKVEDTDVTNENVIGGGRNIDVVVTGKKEGTGYVIFEVENESTGEITSRSFKFTVYSDNKLTMDEYESKATFRFGQIFTQTHKTTVADAGILEVSEDTVEQAGDTGGVLYEVTAKAIKQGETTVTIDILNSDGSKEKTIVYHIEVKDNFEMSLYSVEEE